MNNTTNLPTVSQACVDDMNSNGACLQGFDCPCDCHTIREFDCSDYLRQSNTVAAQSVLASVASWVAGDLAFASWSIPSGQIVKGTPSFVGIGAGLDWETRSQILAELMIHTSIDDKTSGADYCANIVEGRYHVDAMVNLRSALVHLA